MTQKNPPRRFGPPNRDTRSAPKRTFSQRREREQREGDAYTKPRREGGDRPYRTAPRRDEGGDRPYRSAPRRDEGGDRPYRSAPRREGAKPRPFTSERERPAGERPFRPRRDDGPFPSKPRYSSFPEQDEKKQVKLRPRRSRQVAENQFVHQPAKPRTKARSTPEFIKDEMRLNKFISNSGVCSRREADEFIAAGLVTVNGEIVTKMGTRVKSTDDIRFNGERLSGEEKVYIVMNKPKDCVTTTDDPHAEQTVLDLIAGKCAQRVYPVGRLDKSTTGVLLLTNDGALTEQMTHPSYNRKKIYQVDLDRNLKKSDMEQLVKGIILEDGPAYVDEISYIDENEKKIGLEIHSGRNRIVRRMFEYLGYSVKKLDRVYFAGLTKKKLRRGAWRFLTPQEVAMLKMGSYE